MAFKISNKEEEKDNFNRRYLRFQVNYSPADEPTNARIFNFIKTALPEINGGGAIVGWGCGYTCFVCSIKE